MKLFRKIALWGCWLALVLLVGCNRSPETPAHQTAEWTLLFYFDADNDLEDSALRDLQSIIASDPGPSVNLIALCDRCPNDSSEVGYTNERLLSLDDWSTCRLLKLGGGNVEQLADWGEVNMADSQTLARFLSLFIFLCPSLPAATQQ